MMNVYKARKHWPDVSAEHVPSDQGKFKGNLTLSRREGSFETVLKNK